MRNDPITEDRELDLWREQWSGVARPSPEFRHQVQKRIKVQDRRFWLGNLLALAAFVGSVAVRGCYMSLMDHAGDMACGNTVGSRFHGTLAPKSAGSNPETPNRHLLGNWMARVLRGACGGQLGGHQARAHGPSHRIPRNDGGHCAHAAGDLVRSDVVRRRKVAELNEVTRLLEEIETTND
jgi:hypothetical protein